MKKICIIIITLQLCLFLVGCNYQNTATTEISNDLSTVNYNGRIYVLCTEDRDIPEDAERINSKIIDYTLMPLLEYNILYKSKTYPEYLWLETTLDDNSDIFKEAQNGVIVLYKLQS